MHCRCWQRFLFLLRLNFSFLLLIVFPYMYGGIERTLSHSSSSSLSLFPFYSVLLPFSFYRTKRNKDEKVKILRMYWVKKRFQVHDRKHHFFSRMNDITFIHNTRTRLLKYLEYLTQFSLSFLFDLFQRRVIIFYVWY